MHEGEHRCAHLLVEEPYIYVAVTDHRILVIVDVTGFQFRETEEFVEAERLENFRCTNAELEESELRSQLDPKARD